MMNNSKYLNKYKKGFSLVEALMSLALIGIIILMMAPILAGRSSRTSQVYCINGGTQIFKSNGTFNVQNGMERIWITAVGAGGAGGAGGGTDYGSGAGAAGDVWYYDNGRGLNVLSRNIQEIRITFDNLGTPSINIVDVQAGLGPKIGNASVNVNPYKPGNAISTLQNGTYTRAGIPDFGTFNGPLFGAGGRGNFWTFRTQDTNAFRGAVIIEWSTNCVVSERF